MGEEGTMRIRQTGQGGRVANPIEYPFKPGKRKNVERGRSFTNGGLYSAGVTSISREFFISMDSGKISECK